MDELTLPVLGMTCGGCASSVRRALERIPGVAGVEVDLDRKQARVRYDAARLQRADLAFAVEEAGYEVPNSPAAGG